MTNLTNNKAVLSWIDEMTAITKPDKIVWITGEEEQLGALREQAVKEGILIKLNPDKLPGCYLHRTDPDDVARVEDRTFICCEKEEDAGPTNHWVEPKEMYERMYALADGAYKGRTMYIIPYSMSIIGSPFAKYGFELTDSIYVVLNMHIMTRIGKAVCDALGDDTGFIKGLHCQCNLDKDNKYIVHFPQDNTIISMNSNYGGNVLQGKKCFALRIAELVRTPRAIRSNYIARVDKEKCVACGQCVENCQTNALKLGQKRCATDPHISDTYDTDASVPFHRSSYNPEYRTNRSDVMPSGTAPCKAECPAHIPVQGYIKLASLGRYTEALELIKKENPFPAVCGRICNKRCEDACTRGSIDDPIAIDDIKKFIAEKDLEAGTRFVPKMLNQIGRPYTEKIAVIGAGPAGLSCAYYLAVKGYPVTVFEKESVPGGMLTLGIPSFRLEKNVVNAEIDVLKELGVEFRFGVEVGKNMTLDALRADGYKAIYLAVGASKGTPAGCPGDDLKGVFTGVEFLRAVNLGKRPTIGKQVAVIGGGNVAIDVARAAVRRGADVTLLYRRSREEMPAADEEVAEAEAEGVKFRFLCAPVEILGEKGKATAVKVETMTLGEPDEKGRRKPVGTGEFETLAVSAVISAIGQQIDLCGIDAGSKLRLGKRGTVLVDPATYQTDEPDVFAGGDLVTGPKFAIDAIAAGKEAAVSIHRFVHPGQSQLIGRDHRDYKSLDPATVAVPIESFDNTPRQHAHDGSAEEAKKTFHDLRGVFTEEQMKKETERCLGCGAVVLNEDQCIGCGICTTKCKFDAIRLEKVNDTHGREYFRTLLTVAGNTPAAIGRLVRKTRGR